MPRTGRPAQDSRFVAQRFGELKLQVFSSVRVRTELAQASDFSVTLTQDKFARDCLSTSPQLRTVRQKTLATENVKLRQRKLRELCRLATVSRPDICARLALFAPRVNSLQGSDVSRIDGPAKPAKVWQQATVLKYLSSSHARKPEHGREDGRMRKRSQEIHGWTITLAGW